MLSLLVVLTLLLWWSSSNRKMLHKTLRWLSSLNKEDSFFQKLIIQFPMDIFLHSNLSLELYLLKLITGPELMLAQELHHITQMKTKLFLEMVENILTKLLFLLQVSNRLILWSKVFQKWDKLMKLKTSTFMLSTTSWPLIKTTITDGTIEPETWSTILQLNHTRVKALTSTHLSMNLSIDKISNMESLTIQLKFNSSHQTRTSSVLDMQTKLLLRNVERETSMSA